MQKIRAAQGAHPSGQFQRRYLHYPPAHAPLSGRAFVRAFRTLLRGPNAARTALADALRQTFDADHAFLFGSGTQALSAALSFVRQRMGEARPIALPAFTCWDVASAAAAANTEIVFYDVDPITLGPDWASLERALAGGAGAVVIASLYGVPVDWAAVEQLCSRYDAIPVEDAAQGQGATWQGRRLGSLAPVSIISFSRGKGWTGAGGGALLTRGSNPMLPDAPLPSIITEVKVGIAAIAQALLSRPALYTLPASMPWLHLGETRYRPLAGLRRAAAVSAAVVCATATDARDEAAHRRRQGRELQEKLQNSGKAVVPRLVDGAVPGYLRFPVRIPDDELRNIVVRDFHRSGVSRSYPEALPSLQQIAALHSSSPEDFPGARTLARELITLPTHSRADHRAVAQLLALLL